jgi:16S rRNA (adenine1518-N6/adenine1519-N6)-dimethyltransferase
VSHGRSQRKRARLGQNFLVNEGVIDRIVGTLGALRERVVIEIGPGRGALTRALLRDGARVLAVEIDETLAEALRGELASERLDLVVADATRLGWGEILTRALAQGPSPVPFVSNLPYESGTHVLLAWLEASAADARLEEAVVMVQKEVAERVASRPGTKEHASLGVLAQGTHRVTRIMDVAPGSFRPVPKVWSRVLRLVRRADPLWSPDERPAVSSFAQACFAHRRKQLAGSLAGMQDRSREGWQDLLGTLGHEATTRAEDLSGEAIITLWRRAGGS